MHLSDKMLIFSVLEHNLTLTQQMRDKSSKTMEFKAGKADKNFTEERLTSYTRLTVVSKYIQAQGIGKLLDRLFPTVKQNATKFSTSQIMLAVVLVGEKESVCEYEYFCYCSNLNDKDGKSLHELYKKRCLLYT